MYSQKKIFITCFCLVVITLWGFLTQPAFASLNKYYDFGSYYNQSQVLGFSLSSLENLPAPTIPDNLNLPQATGLTPESPLYPLERFTENIRLTLTFEPLKKEELRLEFASERLSEAKTLMGSGKTEAAVQALDDYNQTIKDATTTLSSMASAGSSNTQTLANKIEAVASAQIVITQNLALISTPAQAESWTTVSKTAERALDEIAEVKGEPALPENLSASLQKLKGQGLVSEEESNKIYSLGSRSEVRAELDKLSMSGQFPASELIKLNTAVATYYPQVQEGMTANLQVAELRVYQSFPQPSERILEEVKKWQDNPNIPPPNDIKPYLWHNRALDLAKEVNLSNFSPQQQSQVAKFYPQAIAYNPTYQPAPSPGPSPSPTITIANEPVPASTESGSQFTDQTPSLTQAQPTPSQAAPYLIEDTSVLPGETTYFLKRWGENLQFTFTFDPAEKARLKMQQAERRLAEAKAISTDPKKAELYEQTIKGYKGAIEDASSYLKRSQDEEKAKEVAEKLESQAARHEVVLEKGFLPVPKDAKLISEAIKATENALDRSADIQGRPALPPSLSDRLGDLKAQGLILPEEAEELVRSNSREEAREKIRKLVELGSFPLADSKKLDEAQVLTSPSDYNQLVEVRKVEELQKLRSAQSEFAQTPTLKANATILDQREAALVSSIDPSLIKKEDLGDREDLVKTYEKLISTPRPINSGQFGAEATPGAQIAVPKPPDAVLSACPEGAVFKQFEGCVWANTSKKLNDYDQYKCEGPRQYYSFAVRKCVAYDETKSGNNQDAQPICPVGYNWSWQNQSCQASTGGDSPFPTPSPEPEPKDEEEITKRNTERSKYCPEGSSYKVPRGCVWDKDDKPLYDSDQYRCNKGQYYSFNERKCIAAPKEGEAYPKDVAPTCKEPGTFWSWSDGKCIQAMLPLNEGGAPATIIDDIKPNFVTADSPFYFLKQAGEAVRLATAFTSEARQEIRASQANERLAEGYAALEKGDKETFTKSLAGYTAKMQEIFNDVSKDSLSDEAKKAIGEKLAKEAVQQNLILQKIEVVAKSDDAAALSAASSAVILGVDKAADLTGEPPLSAEVKTKVEVLPEQMISEEEKKKLLETNSRVEARLKLGELAAKGGLTQADTAFLNDDFNQVDKGTQWKIEELKKLEEIATVTDQKKKIEEKVEKNEDIIEKLAEFQKSFEPGKEVPVEIRPYVRLTRIEEVTQTIRPDIVNLEEFQNRKDIVLAVATLQEEFKPTKESIRKVEEFRRRNPNASLPPDLARIEALSYSLGVRSQAETCFLPTPPFPANTPCPPPGAAIPVASYYTPNNTNWYGYGAGGVSPVGTDAPGAPSTDKDGKPLVYGQGPKPVNAGTCPDGYHWMYDSGGWCMSNSGNYSSSSYNQYTPSGTTSGYSPYSPYYSAPGAYPGSSNYPQPYSYSPPSYYGSAPTYYTTNPPAGTVPGTGPQPISPGQCPSGFHWMPPSYNQPGWCMSDAATYVPGGAPSSSYPSGTTTSSTPPAEGYNCGGQPYDPVTKRCRDGACPGGFNWDGNKCVAYNNPGPYFSGSSYTSCPAGYSWNGSSCQPSSSSYSGSYSPSSYQYGCTPGYYWDGSKCVAGNNEGSGWSDTAARSGSYCQPPSGGCGYNSYWDYGNCSCRSSSTYNGGGSSSTCSPPAGGCGSGWFDSGSCSCKQASSQGCYNVSASSCPSGWYFDSSVCTCRQSGGTTTSSGGSTTSSGSSSGSCPSGYHWMSDNGGWCMSDSARDSSGGSTSTTTNTTTTTTTSTEPTPAPSTPTTTTSSPPPSEPAPAPSTSTTTESSPPPSTTTESSPPPSTTTESSPPPP